MSESPKLSNTIIDNLIKRKEIRADAIRRIRARDRIEFSDRRTKVYNALAQLNSKSIVSKYMIDAQLEQSDFPTHLALIPDGNRRYARARGEKVGYGYHIGSKKLEGIRSWAMVDNSVDYMSVFTMSTENIKRRPEDELAQLYQVFANFFNRVAEDEEVHENKIQHEVRGNQDSMSLLPDEVLDAIDNMESATEQYDNKKVVILMPYGSRDDIVKAARMTETPLDTSDQLTVTEKGEDDTEFRQNLILGDLPDVDMMLRTSEKRISNFMLYENAYAEMVFTMKNWPGFTEEDFYESVYKYSNRERRFGV